MKSNLLTGLLAGLFLLGLPFPLAAQTPSAAPPPAAENQATGTENSRLQARITRFNQSINLENPAWGRHPELMVLQWLGLPAPHYRRLESRSNALESPSQITVIATEAGLMDDAIAGARTRFVFGLEAGNWQLLSVQQSWKCRRGSNQKDYLLKPCP